MQIESVGEFISQDLLETKDGNVSLFEGPMWKYKPGFAQHFFMKYCVVTKSAFVYFASKWKAYNSADKPLVAISLSDIEGVQRVSVPLPEEKQIVSQLKKSNASTKPPHSFPKYQMEIFLKEGATIQKMGDYKDSGSPPPEPEERRTPPKQPEESKQCSDKKSPTPKSDPAVDLPPKVIITPEKESVGKEDETFERLHINSEILDLSRPALGEQDVSLRYVMYRDTSCVHP